MSHIRRFRETDRADVAEICLKTGDGGQDATGMHGSDELLADIFALPYVDLEPETCFVVDTGERVSGYIVCAADTGAFVERYRSEWLPAFAQKYQDLEPSNILEMGLDPDRMIIEELGDYPAHLHIDLLPELQGQGMGRMLMRTLLAALRERGVPGVHLGVSPSNTNAVAFYKKLGFRPLPSDAGAGSLLGIRTDAVV
ncbi:GNAT family N-acetyltransferase [Microbacterium sp. A204]|uniref:GNAT family N-acetyltransferase n=1 Tax=Microbacterium sp. A204 TaxID=3457321 RepID=UPI003FD5C873